MLLTAVALLGFASSPGGGPDPADAVCADTPDRTMMGITGGAVGLLLLEQRVRAVPGQPRDQHRRPHDGLVLDHQPLHLREYVRSARLQVIFCVNMRALGTCYVLASNGNSRVKKR